MADYNVNMKQWNGSSFDNVLPLAFNSKALDGKSYDDIIQYVQSKNLLLYTGQYTGTGTSGYNNPNSITFPFEPILILPPFYIDSSTRGCFMTTSLIRDSYTQIKPFAPRPTNAVWIRFSSDRKTLEWYHNYAADQQNISNTIYYYAAIGGYDMRGPTEWIITSSGTWTVPKTGRYYIELYGGGGGMKAGAYSRSGSSSCQTYDSITLQEGDIVSVSVGIGGNSTTQPTGTSFGNYYVDGGKNGDSSTIVSGSGNKGTSGRTELMQYNIKNPSTGTYGDTYGYGINAYSGSVSGTGGPGAVYLKYLGE